MKRGLTQQEAMAYVGVKRRTWEANWAPRLTGIHQGVCLIYDRQDLDKLFDAIKAEAAGEQPSKEQDAANDSAHNAARNGRPSQEKGRNTWAKARGVSTPTKTTTPGKSTSGGAVSDFASAVSLVMKKRNAG